MTKIEISSPSRIHTCLINESGEGKYIHGGIGFAIDTPNNVMTVSDSDPDKSYLDCDVVISDEHMTSIKDAINKLSLFFDKPKVNVHVLNCLPPHCGLGSKTTLLLSVAFAFCKIYNIKFDLDTIISVLGRRGASGISMYSCINGGFIHDKGFYNVNNIKDSNNFFLKDICPTLNQVLYPDSKLKIVHFRFSNGDICGKKERDLIKKYYPISVNETNYLYKVVDEFILSLKNSNIDDLQYFLDILQVIGFKKYEWSQQDKISFEFVRFCRNNKLDHAIGLSSWGPTMYCITYEPELICDIVGRFCSTYNIKPLHLTTSNINKNGFSYKIN